MNIKEDNLEDLKESSFLEETKSEFKKIEWCSKKDIKKYTKAVLIGIGLGSLFVYSVDWLIKSALLVIKFCIKWLIG